MKVTRATSASLVYKRITELLKKRNTSLEAFCSSVKLIEGEHWSQGEGSGFQYELSTDQQTRTVEDGKTLCMDT